MKNDFTIGILTNNDARSISRTLTSSLNITNNIVILDTGSSDKTLDIISDFKKEFPGIRLFETPWNNNFSDARNKLISHTITQSLVDSNLSHIFDLIGWNKFISGDLESSMSMYGHVKNPIYLESRIDQLKNLLNTLEEQKNEAFKNTVY